MACSTDMSPAPGVFVFLKRPPFWGGKWNLRVSGWSGLGFPKKKKDNKDSNRKMDKSSLKVAVLGQHVCERNNTFVQQFVDDVQVFKALVQHQHKQVGHLSLQTCVRFRWRHMNTLTVG